jgi:hypothetical protein
VQAAQYFSDSSALPDYHRPYARKLLRTIGPVCRYVNLDQRIKFFQCTVRMVQRFI